MIEELQELVNANPALVRRGRWTDMVMLLAIGDDNWMVDIKAGRIHAMQREEWAVSGYDVALRAPRDAWEAFWQPLPPPMHHDLSALVRAGKMRLEGNIDLLMANFLYVKLMLEVLRRKDPALAQQGKA